MKTPEVKEKHCNSCIIPLGMSYPASYTCWNTCPCHLPEPIEEVGGKCNMICPCKKCGDFYCKNLLNGQCLGNTPPIITKANPYLDVLTNETKMTPPITTKAEWEIETNRFIGWFDRHIGSFKNGMCLWDIADKKVIEGMIIVHLKHEFGLIKDTLIKQVEQDTEKRVVGEVLKAIEPVVETRQVWQVKEIINNLKSKYE